MEHSQRSIEDPSRQDKLTANLPVPYLLSRQFADDLGIVRAPFQHHVHASHSCHQRNDAQRHDLVFHEHLFRPDPSPKQADNDDDESEHGAPPGNKKRRVVRCGILGRRWGRVQISED